MPAFLRRLLALCVLLLALPARAATLSFADGGLVIDAGTMGRFTLSWPEALVGEARQKPSEHRVDGRTATLRYPSGGTVTMALEGQDRVTYAIAGLPTGSRALRQDMHIDFGYSEGGRWQIGETKSEFPAAQPEKPHLFQGNADRFVLTDPLNQTLTFQLPPYTYQQLQDNREWGWKIFAWMFIAPLNPDNPRQTLTITQAAAGERPAVVVDQFGQDATLDFPWKVRSLEELRADVAADEAYYGGLQPPVRNAYGSLPGSGQPLGLKKTGFYHVEQTGGKWVLVDPEGELSFHLGICGFGPGEDFTYIKGREQLYEWLPPYEGEYHDAFHPEPYWSRDTFSFYLANLIRKYQQPIDRTALTARMIQRVRALGFNASGAFSGSTPAHRELRFPYVSSLPISEWQLGRHIPGLRGLFDPFDAETAAKLDELFARSVAPNADQPLLLGYFFANEQAFEDIPRVIPALKSTPAKLELVKLLRERYPTVEAFNQAWGMQAASFDALADAGLPVTTAQAAADVQAYKERFLEAYYRLMTETFRKYDPNHMLIGDRWQPRTANDETLCRIAGKYHDIISVNYYTYALDPAFLQRIHTWSGGRPMMLSEFYWASPSDTGLPGGNEVNGQHERGLAYRNYVEGAAATGFIVGIEWFTLIDQARTGRWFERYSGEKANTGLFNVADRPYKDFLAEAMQTNYTIEDVVLGRRPPFVFDHPRFRLSGPSNKVVKVMRATAPMVLDGSRDEWPGVPPELISPARVVLGADAGGVEGAFRLAWDDQKLYLLVHVTDPTPMRNDHEGGSLWNADAIELFLGPDELDQPGPLRFSDRQVLLGAGRSGAEARWYYANAPAQGPAELVVVPDADGKGYTLEAALPFAALGFEPADGKTILFDLAIDDGATGGARQRQLMWNGQARNSSDRGAWGRATFVR